MSKKWFSTRSLKQKTMMIFSFFLVVSAVFSLFMYNYSVSIVRESIIERNNSQAEFFVDSVDSQIATAEEMVHNLLFDRRLAYLILPNDILDDYELMQAYLAQQERMKHLLLSSPLIESSVIYLPNRKQKITDNFIGDMSEAELLKVREINKDATKTVTYTEGQLYIATSGVYYSSNNQLPDILFVVNFSAEKLATMLTDFNIYPESMSFFQMDSENFIFGETHPLLVDSETHELAFELSGIETENTLNQNLKIKNQNYRIFSIKSDYLGVFFQLIPHQEIFGTVNQAHLILFFYLFAMSIIAFYISRYLNNHVHDPLNILVNLFRDVESGDLENKALNYSNQGKEFNYVFASFNEMKVRLKNLIDEVYVQKNLAQRAQLKQLQSQINPHFLYNSFHSLNRKLKRGDSESAAQLAEHLGTYFQFLARSDEDIISLEEEVLHAKSYTSVQQIRFYDRVEVIFEEIPEIFKTQAVPRLILQPVIENAFKYGLENLEQAGKLAIMFIADMSKLTIRVEDNGEDLTDEALWTLQQRLDDPKPNEISGLINIHRRLKIFLGESSGIQVSRNAENGLRVDIVLVLKNK